MTAWLCSMTPVDVATILAAFGAISALYYSARANTLTANALSLELTYDFHDRSRSHVNELKVAADSAAFKMAFEATLDFFEVTCHGLNKKIIPRTASQMMRKNMINYIAVLELTGAAQDLTIPTSDVYAELASFARANRASINRSKTEQATVLAQEAADVPTSTLA